MAHEPLSFCSLVRTYCPQGLLEEDAHKFLLQNKWRVDQLTWLFKFYLCRKLASFDLNLWQNRSIWVIHERSYSSLPFKFTISDSLKPDQSGCSPLGFKQFVWNPSKSNIPVVMFIDFCTLPSTVINQSFRYRSENPNGITTPEILDKDIWYSYHCEGECVTVEGICIFNNTGMQSLIAECSIINNNGDDKALEYNTLHLRISKLVL